MSFEFSESTFIDAAHHLTGEQFGTGQRLHGHTYGIVVTVRKDDLQDDGLVISHYDAFMAIQRVRNELHDSSLDDHPVLGKANATPEVIGRYIWGQLADEMRAFGATSLAVDVRESPTRSIRYDARLDQAT